MKKFPSPVSGFSLVEVTLALAIVSFGLLALVGLFTLGLNSSRQSGDDTILASSVAKILAGYRANEKSTAGLDTNIFLDAQGEQLDTEAGALYDCHLSTAYPDVSCPVTGLSNHIVIASLKCSWPLNAPSVNRKTASFFATLPSK
jgi:uncharacterized protein (TIGR02598 family)